MKNNNTLKKQFGIGLIFCASLSHAGTVGTPLVANKDSPYYFSIAGVGALANFNNIVQSYEGLSADAFIPSLNDSHHTYGTGGVSAAIGYQRLLGNLANLQASVQYLYLAGQNRQIMPFYNTDVYESAFLDSVNVQTVTFNLGLNRNIFKKLSIYADAGLGVAILSAYGAYTTNAALPLLQSQTHTTTPFTWQAGGGLRYDLFNNVRLNGGVHYANFGHVNYGSFAQTAALPNGVNFQNKQFSAVLFSLGVDYSFAI